MTTSKKRLALILAAALIILLILLGILMVWPPSPPISPPTPLQTYTLTITHTTGGTTDPAPGNYTYPEDTIVTVNATAFTGYLFDYWNLDGSTVAGPPSINVTMDSNHTLQAVFALPTHTLTISTTTGGTTNPAPGVHIYAHGTEVQVNATANIGYVFDHWELDSLNVGSAIPCVVTMNTDHLLHAVFKPLYYTLTIATTAGGTTNPEPGSHQFPEETVVNVTAIPETNFILDHWKLDGVNQGAPNPIDVTMNTNHTLLAVFEPLYTLTITSTAGGTTDPPPNTYQHKEGTVVEVTAIAYSGYVFHHWELDTVDIGDDNPTSVTMNADHTLHAVFTQITYTLTISITGEGKTDPAEGSHVYFSGTNVSVTATPKGGYKFDHWELDGSDVGSANRYNVTMNADHALRAVFKASPVGGHALPIDKSRLLAPKIDLIPRIGLTFVLLAAMAVTIILIRRKTRH